MRVAGLKLALPELGPARDSVETAIIARVDLVLMW